MIFSVSVHDDGTLENKDMSLVLEYIPSATIITYKEATIRISKRLERYPYVRQAREHSTIRWQMQTLVDIPLLTKTKRILYLDTDIIFYRKPKEILNWLTGPQDSLLFMNDVKESQMLRSSDFTKIFGVKYIHKFNMGILGYQLKKYNLRELEQYISRLHASNTALHYWVEQTYWMLHASKNYNKKIRLSPKYFIPLTGRHGISKNTICCHFAGPSRKFIYKEALRWTLNNA